MKELSECIFLMVSNGAFLLPIARVFNLQFYMQSFVSSLCFIASTVYHIVDFTKDAPIDTFGKIDKFFAISTAPIMLSTLVVHRCVSERSIGIYNSSYFGRSMNYVYLFIMVANFVMVLLIDRYNIILDFVAIGETVFCCFVAWAVLGLGSSENKSNIYLVFFVVAFLFGLGEYYVEDISGCINTYQSMSCTLTHSLWHILVAVAFWYGML